MSRSARSPRVFLLLLLWLGLSATTAAQTVYRVGAFGAPCTHATLEAAIADASTSLFVNTVIKIANSQVYNGINVNLSGKNLTLEGGYLDCVANRPATGVRTILFGAAGAADSVIEIIGGASQRQIVLRNLEITGGESDDDGGGGVEIDGDVIVTFDDLVIRNNVSGNGGGVHVSGANGPVELRLVGDDTRIGVFGEGNSAALGGGLHCEQATLVVDSVLWVERNAGRGLYLDDCDLTVGSFGADAAELHVRYNTGGGLYARGGSHIVLQGATHTFHSNEAAVAGGGISLLGPETALIAGRISISGNQVYNDDIVLLPPFPTASGGGLYLGAGAIADLDGGAVQPCPDFYNYPAGQPVPEHACVRFRQNTAETLSDLGSAVGGAIYVSNSQLVLRQARLVGNSAISGTAIHAGGTQAEVLLESVVIDHNEPGIRALELKSGVDATVAFATLIDASDEPQISVEGDGTVLNFHSSVIAMGTSSQYVDSEATVQVSCLFGPAGSEFPVIAFAGFSAFVNALSADYADYRPSVGSVLIDRCTDTLYAPTSRDAIGVLRPVDDPNENHGSGTYDAGAYERLPNAIFADSFESP